MAIITFPKILSDRLADEGARALAEILNSVENTSQKTTLEIAEQKFERRLAQLDAKIDKVASDTKAELIKWMFVFWVGQTLTTFGMFQFFMSHH